MNTPEGLRGQAEQRIDRRLNFSQGLQRGLLGLGIVAGIASGAHDATDGSVGLPWKTTVGIAAAGGGTERRLARRAASRTVTNYEEAMGADPGSYQRGPNHDFIDSSVHQDPIERSYPFLNPYLGWAGVAVATTAAMSEHVAAIGEQVPGTALGVTQVAGVIILGEADQATHRKLREVYHRQLDNVDANVASRGEPA